MRNNYERNRGRNKVVLSLGSYCAAGLGGLRFTARLTLVLILGGMSWLLLLGLSALGWMLE